MCDGHLHLCLLSSDSKHVLQHTVRVCTSGVDVFIEAQPYSLLRITPRTRHSPTLWLKDIGHVISAEGMSCLRLKVASPLLVWDIVLALANHMSRFGAMTAEGDEKDLAPITSKT